MENPVNDNLTPMPPLTMDCGNCATCRRCQIVEIVRAVYDTKGALVLLDIQSPEQWAKGGGGECAS